jgi:hypothetical protein
VSTLLHATVYLFLHNLLNVLVEIANKMGFRKEYFLFLTANLIEITQMHYEICFARLLICSALTRSSGDL